MSFGTVRMNITIPKELADSLNRVAGARKRSGFISEAIREKIERKEKQGIDDILEEGYAAGNKNTAAITKEFQFTETDELWDEYY